MESVHPQVWARRPSLASWHFALWCLIGIFWKYRKCLGLICYMERVHPPVWIGRPFSCWNFALWCLIGIFENIRRVICPIKLHVRKLPCWESSDVGWGYLKFLVARVLKTTSNDRARVNIQPTRWFPQDTFWGHICAFTVQGKEGGFMWPLLVLNWIMCNMRLQSTKRYFYVAQWTG